MTAPISDFQFILGKFLGAYIFLLLITASTIYMPLFIQVNGKVSWGQIFAGYLGLACLGASVTAMGTFASSIAKNQLFSAVLGGGILVFFLLGWLLGDITASPLSEIFAYIALFDKHFQPFMTGKINSEALVFYISIAIAFLLLATRIAETRRQL